MAKRVNTKVDNCWACPWVEWLDDGYDEYDDFTTSGYFCRRNQRLVVEQGNYDYVEVYNEAYGNNGFPNFCDLPEDNLEPIPEDEEEE